MDESSTCADSMITDIVDDCEREKVNDLEQDEAVNEICDKLSDTNVSEPNELEDELEELQNKLEDYEENEYDEEACWQTEEWKNKEKHVFILSSAGKPIYSR